MGHLRACQEKDATFHLKVGDRSFELSVPDLSGEAWEQIWAERCCDKAFLDLCQTAGAIILFVHVNDIRPPVSVIDMAAMAITLEDASAIENQETGSSGVESAQEDSDEWEPEKDCPTQAILVDLLQILAWPPLSADSRRVAVVLSAWDCISDGRTPDIVLAEELPLLSQYLQSGFEYRDWKVFGVSAQGGPIETNDEKQLLLSISDPTERIVVVESDHPSHDLHDLSQILSWLLNGQQPVLTPPLLPVKADLFRIIRENLKTV